MASLAASIRKKAGIAFASAGTTLTQMDFLDPDQGRVELRNGTYAVHVAVPSGAFSGSDLISAAEASSKHGDGRIRLDVEQGLYLMGVDEQQIGTLFTHRLFTKYKNVDTPYFNRLVACAGRGHCPSGAIANKSDAIDMAAYLSERVPLEEGRVRMYWSACDKGCGLHGVGDIGFEGCEVKVDGVNEAGVHISIGGTLTGEGREGRTVLRSVPLRYAPGLVAPLMAEYRRLKKPGESFEQFNDRVLSTYTIAAVGFMMRLKAYLDAKNIVIDFGFRSVADTRRFEQFEVFDFGRKLYYQLVGREAYRSYEMFKPIFKEGLKEPITRDDTIDPNLSALIYKMIHPDEAERAVVFSELNAYIAIY